MPQTVILDIYIYAKYTAALPYTSYLVRYLKYIYTKITTARP